MFNDANLMVMEMRTLLSWLIFPCLLLCQTLTISPTYAPGTVIVFVPEAPIPAAGLYSVVWSASAGSITQQGVYTVPNVPDGTIVTVNAGINPIGKIATSTLTVSRSAAPQGPPGVPGPMGPPGAPGAPGTPGAPAVASPWKYSEIPTGSYPSPRAYGTGFVLFLKCAAVPATVHLYGNGLLYKQGTDYYLGSYAVTDAGLTTQSRTLPANQIGALTFDFGLSCLDRCDQIQVDYQYVPDGSVNCP